MKENTMKQIHPIFWSIIAVLACPAVHGAQADCFVSHMREAKHLNMERKPVYAKLSAGRSLVISNQLIRSESLGLAVAWSLEQLARPLRRQGINIFCDNLVKMSSTPPMSDVLHEQTDPSRFDPTLGQRARGRLAEAFRGQNYQRLGTVATEIVDELSETPRFHCMARHLTESIGRAALLAEGHIQKAHELGKGWMARGIINNYIRMQIAALTTAGRLDSDAMPLQAEGLGIICDDVPPIPLPAQLVMSLPLPIDR